MQIIYLKNNSATINSLRHIYKCDLLPNFIPSNEKLEAFINDFSPDDESITRRERHLQKVNCVLASLTVVVADDMVRGNLTGLLTDEFGEVGKRIRTVYELAKLKKLKSPYIWVPFPLSCAEYEMLCDLAPKAKKMYICDINLAIDDGETLALNDDDDTIDSIVTVLPMGTTLTPPIPGQRCVITAIPPKNFYNYVGEYIVLKKYSESGDVIIEGKGKRQKNIGKCCIMPKNIINNVSSLVGRSHSTRIINLSGDDTLLKLYGYTQIL